jgi:hypothetical protein
MAFRYGPGPILDSFPGATAAYGLRKLNSAYNGPCITVRRSSDNATANIGFFRYTLDTDAVLNFVGNGTGFVTTWYDQSANGVNLFQSTVGSQFIIYDSGSLFYEGSDVVMNAPTAKGFLRNTNSTVLSNWTVYVKSRMTNAPNGYGQYVGHPSSIVGLIQHPDYGLAYFNSGYIEIGGGTSSQSYNYRKIQFKRNGTTTNVRGYQNGVNLGNNNVPVDLNISTNGRVFHDFAGGGYTGTIREMIIYPVEHNDFTILQINNSM